MELINNTTKTLRDDLSVEMKKGSKLSIAAACFSIYAFQELKKQLSDIDELRFIFTSPTFITEKAKALEVAASRAFFLFHFLLQWTRNHQVRAPLFAV